MATKYPIVLVHGIAAKQLRILNAFGKIGNKRKEAERIYNSDGAPKFRKVKTLTKDEYRMWRAGCETLQRGLHSGKMGSIVRCDAGYYIMAGKKIVITTGEYPFNITGILSFGTHDEQIEYMLYMKRKWYK